MIDGGQAHQCRTRNSKSLCGELIQMGMQEEDDILGPDQPGLPMSAEPRKSDSPEISGDVYAPSTLPTVKEVAQFVRQVTDLYQGWPKQVSMDEVQRLANKGSLLIRACSKQFAPGRQQDDPLNDLKSQGQSAELMTQSLRLLLTRLARMYHEPSDRVIALFHERALDHVEALKSDSFFSAKSYPDQVGNALKIARWELKFDAGLRPFEPAQGRREGIFTPRGDYLPEAGNKEWDRVKAKVPIPDSPYGVYGTLRLDLTKSDHRIALSDVVDDLCRWVGKELNFVHVQEMPSANSLAASEARQSNLEKTYRLYSVNLPHAVKRVAHLLEKKACFELVDENVAETLRQVLHPSKFIQYGE